MDVIDRQAALEAMDTWDKFGCGPDGKLVRYDDDKHYIPYVHYEDMVHVIKHLPSVQQWIPFTTRPLTEEEKEEHPEWDSILDCKLPEDGQQILVSVNVRGHESVQYDEFYEDDGYYLDSGYEIGTEAVAWRELPKMWEGGQDGNA